MGKGHRERRKVNNPDFEYGKKKKIK